MGVSQAALDEDNSIRFSEYRGEIFLLVFSLYHCSCFEYMYPLEHKTTPIPSRSRVSPSQQDQLLMPR
jgi:hypothetical protein